MFLLFTFIISSIWFPLYYTRADEPMARVPQTARIKISLANGIPFCPNILSFARPASLYCEECRCMCVYTHIYIHHIYIYTHTQYLTA